MENRGVNTRRDNGKLLRVRTVVLAHLLRLQGSIHNHPARGATHQTLGAVAFLRLGCFTFAAARILGGSRRMRSEKNGDREASALSRPQLGCASRSLTRQPIVGVNNIRGVQCLLHTRLRKIIGDRSQLVLRKTTSGRKIKAVAHNALAGLRRLMERRISRKRLTAVQRENLNPQLGIELQHGVHRPGNIDVHAACISATGLRKRVGVHGIHVNRPNRRQSAHRCFPLSKVYLT